MKKKIFLLVVMLVALFSVKEVNAVTVSKVTVATTQSSNCNYVFSIKQNKLYEIPLGHTTTLAEEIEGKIGQDELIDGDSLVEVRVSWYGHSGTYCLTQENNIIYSGDENTYEGTYIYGSDITSPVVYLSRGYTSLNLSTVKKGTIVLARSITANGETSRVFYADKDYKIKSFMGGYNSYFVLEPVDDDPEEPVTPDEPNNSVEPTKQEDYKLDLKCLSDKDGSHHCELYYNRVNSESNESEFKVKFRVNAKNVEGQITINDKTLELESNKEYTVNGKCSDSDCKVLLAKFNTKDINKNSSSSMEIEPLSLKIDGEDKPINIENSKCEYSKEIENPKTSTYIILVATIIFIVFGGLLIVLRKKDVLTRV